MTALAHTYGVGMCGTFARFTHLSLSRFIHQMAMVVKQAELAVLAMRDQMKGFLDIPRVTLN